MTKLFSVLLTFLSISAFAQTKATKEAQPIVAEGKLLYKSEMASWYGTDIFLEQYKKSEDIRGYFSYVENNVAKCIFYSKGNPTKVIGTISFDSTYNPQNANTDLTERDFSSVEKDLYEIRELALSEMRTDSMFKVYPNTNLNLIPIINNNEKKVYVLTGPKNSGVVIFGNDFLLTFDRNNKLKQKKQLHKNILPIEYGKEEENGNPIVGGVHSHLPETGEFITATDICTLMLYEKFTKWKTYNVVSEKYLNIWNCESNELIVIDMKTVKKINEYQRKK